MEIYCLQRSKESFLVQESTWCKLVSTKAVHCLNVTKVSVWNCKTTHTALSWGNVLYSVILITVWAQFSVQSIHRKQRDCKGNIKRQSANRSQIQWNCLYLQWTVRVRCVCSPLAGHRMGQAVSTGPKGAWSNTLCIHTYVYINMYLWEIQLLFWETRKERDLIQATGGLQILGELHLSCGFNLVPAF